MFDVNWEPTSLKGRATGTVIEVILQNGALFFSINDGPPVLAVAGFPPDQPLRPWVVLNTMNHRVAFTRGYYNC